MFGALPPGLDPENTFHRGPIERLPRGPGRPKGATNKLSKDVKTLIYRLLGDPLLAQADWARHTPESLARVLGCSKLEAFDRLMQIHRELAPFLHARMAPVDGDGNAVVPTFTMSIGSDSKVTVAAGAPPWIGEWSGFAAPGEPDQKSQQNQAFSSSQDDVSHGDVSHGDGK